MKPTANLILQNGRVTTLDPKHPEAKEVIIADGHIAGVDNAEDFQSGPETKVVDLQGRRVIPGLYDSHLHVIRGGLNYNMELRWEGVPSVSLALQMLREQAARTPAPQWVRVVGGWTEFQFAERRMPTLDEINAAAPDTPVFVLHLYCRALLNRAALKACGYTKDTPNPPGRGDCPRQGRQSHRHARRPAERDHSLRHAGKGAEASAGISIQLDKAFHAGIEPPRPDERV
jgi:predicted amidohydrolase YtcJ